jgi:hypothetical protein
MNLVIGLALALSHQHNIDYSLGENGKLHKLDRANFSYPHVAIPACQPNTIKNLHVHGSPYVPQNMYLG